MVASCPPSGNYLKDATASKLAYVAFWRTGSAQFWGSSNHIEIFLERIRAAAPTWNMSAPILIDAGAAPYNTVGGDISHVLAYFRLWGCRGPRAEPSPYSAQQIIGFEPMVPPFERLVSYVRKVLPTDYQLKSLPSGAVVLNEHGRQCMLLRNRPLSGVEREVSIAAQPFAGDNTASLEAHYQGHGARRVVKALTLDAELQRISAWRRGESDVLVLKVDVEGHEMSVLEGGKRAIAQGRVHIILLEYGDKTSPTIWNKMKKMHSAEAVAPSPQEMQGTSLYSIQRWGRSHGYETFLLGGNHRQPVLIPLTDGMWDDSYEVCRDKRLKYSPDGKHWRNFSAWNPSWSAVCWYDVVLIRRASKLLLHSLLAQSALSNRFCNRLQQGWYPSWVTKPSPTNLKCGHKIARPDQGQVCEYFIDADNPENAAQVERIAKFDWRVALQSKAKGST
ncbi:hypothetical protein AB1Y20_021313 [Prymnesium parvum]|uniref:Methyltransferase FkbM domain-containing protein n=1 Tax=Prymnesium parvum TaxID=97485 RepID=A0AB34JLN3_PRYPA